MSRVVDLGKRRRCRRHGGTILFSSISLMDLSLQPMSGLKSRLDFGGGSGMDFLLNGHISFQFRRRRFLRSNIHEQFNKQELTTQWSKRKASDEDDASSVIHTIVINTQMNSTGK
jgi:hypothetical protein